MHVHPPKAPHSWSELGREIGVIVIGILIALGFEQVAERWHWSHSVHQGREALHREMARNDRYFAERTEVGACVSRHVAATKALVDYAASHGRTLAATGVGLKTGNLIETSEWEAQKAAQSLVHFPAEERSALSTYYSLTSDLGQWRSEEGQIWDGLAVLEGPSRPISDSEVAALRAMVIRAQHLNRLWELNGPAQLERSKRLGVHAQPPSQGFINQACQDIQTG